MPRESSDSIYLGPTKRGLTDILHLQSVSRSSNQILLWSSVVVCNTGLFQGSQKQSLDFHLMPGLINQFKKSNCTQKPLWAVVQQKTVASSGRTAAWTHTIWNVAWLDLKGEKQPVYQGWSFFLLNTESQEYLSSGSGSAIIRTRKIRFYRLMSALKKQQQSVIKKRLT